MSAIIVKKLPEHLLLVEKATKQFLKETEGKSWEQFEAEIEALKHLLDHAKLIHPERIERPFQMASL
jgi:hypothetical protein